MQNELISVIVPVYKVEPYFNRCVDSILAQTHKSLQVILVNDGSPDNCPAICDEYAKKDSRVQVIHKKNGGLSDARNAGLKVARGQWLSFIDSDDYIEPNMYERLLELALEHDAQISFSGVRNELVVNGKTVNGTKSSTDTVQIKVRDKKQAIEHFLTHPWAAWDKIYRKEIFDGIVFPVGQINEDEAIALHQLEKCTRAVYTNESFYHYVTRADSITTASFSAKKLDWYKHCRDNLTWIDAHYPEFHTHAEKRFFTSVIWSLTQISEMDKSYLQYAPELLGDVKKHYKEFCSLSKDSLRLRSKLFLFRYFPFSLYSAIARKIRN